MTAEIRKTHNLIKRYTQVELVCPHVQRVRRFLDYELVNLPTNEEVGESLTVDTYIFTWIDREIIGLQHECPGCWPNELVKPTVDRLKKQAFDSAVEVEKHIENL